MNVIPTDSTLVFWNQVTTLDGTDYFLSFRYNQRENCFYLQISLSDQTVLCQGIKLVSNYRLLQAYADDRLPPGELIAQAYGSDDSPAAIGELGIGQRVELSYLTVAELTASGLDGWRRRI